MGLGELRERAGEKRETERPLGRTWARGRSSKGTGTFSHFPPKV